MKYQRISQHPSVLKYLKGSFNLRPPLPKISFVWDAQIMFEYFRSLGDNRLINKVKKKSNQVSYLVSIHLIFQISEVIFRPTDNRNDVGNLSVSRGTKNAP